MCGICKYKKICEYEDNFIELNNTCVPALNKINKKSGYAFDFDFKCKYYEKEQKVNKCKHI